MFFLFFYVGAEGSPWPTDQETSAYHHQLCMHVLVTVIHKKTLVISSSAAPKCHFSENPIGHNIDLFNVSIHHSDLTKRKCLLCSLTLLVA